MTLLLLKIVIGYPPMFISALPVLNLSYLHYFIGCGYDMTIPQLCCYGFQVLKVESLSLSNKFSANSLRSH